MAKREHGDYVECIGYKWFIISIVVLVAVIVFAACVFAQPLQDLWCSLAADVP